jgi:hypothetical protein
MTRHVLTASDEATALEDLHAAGCTDGLPVIVPTPERVERMILASGQPGDLRVATMGPSQGSVTIELVAAAVVMAGCTPDHLPLVLTAVEAVCDPVFDLTEVQGTTHAVAPLVIINGPARLHCEVACGAGALGPGHRANASIGRALRLAMINIGGARPGVSDMALLGHPGKFTSCLGEAEEDSPFPPLSVARGVPQGVSAVTVAGVEAPRSVIYMGDADDPASARSLLRLLALTIASPAANNAVFGRGSVVVLLNPEHAALLAGLGYDRHAICTELARLACNPRGFMHQLNPVFVADGDPDELIPAVRAPEDILLAVAGGPGGYSVVLPSWAHGPHLNQPVTRIVPEGGACEIPGMSGPDSAGPPR